MRVMLSACAGLLSVALLGCSGQTQLIVSVDTDYEVPADVDELLFEVTGPSGTTREARQSLADAEELPHTLTVIPSGEALGPVEIRVSGLRAGAVVVAQEARVTLLAGQSTALRMFLHRQCAAVTCDTGETCRCGACVDVSMDIDPWTGGVATGDPCMVAMDGGADAAPPDGGGDLGDGGGTDGGPSCTSNAECDDGIDCTRDACSVGACEIETDNTACVEGTGGVCVAGFGCQYDGCSPSTCIAGPCEVARCDGDTCVLEPTCGATEECCGGACVPLGCDDGNPCTDDSCGATGCDYSNNTAICEDPLFCNGADTCVGGACNTHAGDPCGGSSVCDESLDSCVGCTSDADCPADILSPWGACSYDGGSCDESGTRQRTSTSFQCVASVCSPTTVTLDEACSRPTEGTGCGSTTFGGWGACGGFSGMCGETGTRTRTRTDRVCTSGVCSDANSPVTGSCVRDTDTNSCGMTTYGSWGSCGGYANTCDDTGTRSRSQMTFACASGACQTTTGNDTETCSRMTDGVSCGTTTYGTWGSCGDYATICATAGTRSRTQTDYTCSSATCGTVPGTDTGSCTRVTNGDTCGTTTYGSWGPCGGYSSICDETGTRSRTAMQLICSSGACGSSNGTDTGSCSRNTNGDNCDSFLTCQLGNCSGGSCDFTGAGCSVSECCEPGICRAGGFCP